jgi:hypothetical protein
MRRGLHAVRREQPLCGMECTEAGARNRLAQKVLVGKESRGVPLAAGLIELALSEKQSCIVGGHRGVKKKKGRAAARATQLIKSVPLQSSMPGSLADNRGVLGAC